MCSIQPVPSTQYKLSGLNELKINGTAKESRNPIENSLTDMQGEKKGDEKDEEQNRGSEPTGIHLMKDTKGDQKDEELNRGSMHHRVLLAGNEVFNERNMLIIIFTIVSLIYRSL